VIKHYDFNILLLSLLQPATAARVAGKPRTDTRVPITGEGSLSAQTGKPVQGYDRNIQQDNGAQMAHNKTDNSTSALYYSFVDTSRDAP
jgi:hypothetical protein